MRRKIRRRNRKNFPFTVRARNLSCREAITEKAKEQGVTVKKGGRPKLRLYFACSEDEWRRFYHQIKGFCTVEEQHVMCSCPQELQKTMLKNLAAARNDRVSPARAQKASDLLAAINTEPIAVHSQTQVRPATRSTSVVEKPVKQAARTFGERIKRSVRDVLHNINSIFAIGSRKRQFEIVEEHGN